MDVDKLAIDLLLKGMTKEQQNAALDSIKESVTQAKAIQKQRIGENVQVVVQALKKLESDIKARYDETGRAIEKRVASIKDGKDGQNGVNGKDGRDGRPGRDGATGPKGNDGLPGRHGIDGVDGVSVTNAFIDFDGSLIINLSNGQDLNVGEVVAPDLAEKIKVITNGGGTSQQVLDTLASLQTQINNLIPSQTGNSGKFLTTNGSVLSWDNVAGGLDYQGTWDASTNTPTLASGVGINGYYYITATAGSTNLDGITDWQIGDWLLFNGTVWQKIDQSNLVTSVNGQTGAVSLTTTNINEGTNLYYTDARARTAISAGTGISYDSATGVVTNASPDQTVSLTGSGATTVTGTYPNFTIASTGGGSVTSVSGTGTVSGISLSGTVTTSGNLTLGGTLDLSSPPTIGNTAPNTGRFTTLTVDDNTTLGTSNSDTVTFNARINSDFDPATDNAFDLGRVGHEWRNLYIDGTANIDSLVADTADINGGTIDGATIGGASAAAATVTTLNTSGLVVFNDAGADVDFRVEGDTNANLLFVDASADAVGIGTDTPAVLAHLQSTTATTNAVTQVLRLDSQSSGTPANGIGVGMQFSAETAAGNAEIGATIEAITTDVTSTSENFDLSFKTMAAGAAAAERVRIKSTGDFQFNSGYGSVATAYACRAWVNFDGTLAANLTGTYTRTSPSTTVTVTATSHGLIVGNSVSLDFTSGTGVDGEYTVVTVADANTFTVTTVASTTTSGNVTLERNAIRASGNVSSISDNGTGLYTLNFMTALPDANYAVTTGVDSYSGTAVSTRAAQGVVLSSFSTTSVQVFTGTTSGINLADNPLVCVAIFR
jgi:hypothetical protein